MPLFAVAGARGQLGQEFVRVLGRRAVGLERAQLDIADGAACARVLGELRPRVVINCAAFNQVDWAETRHAAALAANAEGPGRLAALAVAQGFRLVHFSTDYVFGGDGLERPRREEDAPAPVNFYGYSKLLGEEAVLRTLTGAGPGVAAPRHPLDARPGRGPREPQPGRARAASFAGGGPPLRECGTATSCWRRPPSATPSRVRLGGPGAGRAVAGLRSPATDARTCSWRLRVAAIRSPPHRCRPQGERCGPRVSPEALVLRVAHLYGGRSLSPGRASLVERIVERARAGQPIAITRGQWLNPTSVRDIVAATLRLLEMGATGLFHLTGEGDCRADEFAREVCRRAGLRPKLRYVTHDARPAQRARHTVLANARWAALGLAPLPHWQVSLPAALQAAMR